MTRPPDPMRGWRIGAAIFAVASAIPSFGPFGNPVAGIVGAIGMYLIIWTIGKVVTFLRRRKR